MKASTLEWLVTGEADLASVDSSLKNRLLFRLACYYSHQSAEKYIKALYTEKDTDVVQTHNLDELVTELPTRLAIEVPHDLKLKCSSLIDYSVKSGNADEETALKSKEFALDIKDFVLALI